MKLEKLGDNVSLLITNHGYEFLYSYQTPVAGYSPLIGYFKVNKFYSNTTSKHINKYLKDKKDIVELNPTAIENMGAHI